MRNLRNFVLLLLIITGAACNTINIDIPEITADELREHVEYLASEDLQGRLPGTPGDLASAEYIRDMMLMWGLDPLCDNGLQKFDIVASVVPGESCSLSIDGLDYVNGKDFHPFSISENGNLEAEVIFGGYGFSIETENLKWNDYQDLDVLDKWVMILRADPEVDNAMSNFASFSGDRDKAMLAKDKGAGGVLLVSGEKFDQKDEFEGLKKGEFSVGIPVLRISRTLADKILADSEKTIAELELTLNENRKPGSFTTGKTVNGNSELSQELVNTQNVIMQLPGTDPVLKNQYVIIGGHYDHLGTGGPGSSSRAVDTIAVHYGADDNASGIASMLEMAEKAASLNNNKRTLIFTAFAAEEMGLLGSKHLVENLPFEADSVNAMINLDMVGRLKENKLLQIGGVGTSPILKDLIYKQTDTTFFDLSLSNEGYGPSDHSSFYGLDIPVLFISTGAHLDYHTPFDTPERINYEGMEAITTLVYNYMDVLAKEESKLAFTEAGPKTQVTRGMRRKGVTLGIMPDFAGNIKNGLRADFITPGKPAQLGGMLKGDIITAINGMAVNNIQDYMFRLSKLNHGETINLEIIRDGEKELLLIKL
jgi:aminopeptidase YwaD